VAEVGIRGLSSRGLSRAGVGGVQSWPATLPYFSPGRPMGGVGSSGAV